MARIRQTTTQTDYRDRCTTGPTLKGGMLKSTTAAEQAEVLARLGYKVLICDLDPNAGISTICGVVGHPPAMQSVLETFGGAPKDEAAAASSTLKSPREAVRYPELWQPDAEYPFSEGGAAVAGGSVGIIPVGENFASAINREDDASLMRLTRALAHDDFAAEFDIIFVDAGGIDGPGVTMALYASLNVLFTLVPKALETRGFTRLVDTVFATAEAGFEFDLLGVAVLGEQRRRAGREAVEFARSYTQKLDVDLDWIGLPVPIREGLVEEAKLAQAPISQLGAWRDTKTNRTRGLPLAIAYAALALATARRVVGDESADRACEALKKTDLPHDVIEQILSAPGVSSDEGIQNEGGQQ